jgi:hypothetical protein
MSFKSTTTKSGAFGGGGGRRGPLSSERGGDKKETGRSKYVDEDLEKLLGRSLSKGLYEEKYASVSILIFFFDTLSNPLESTARVRRRLATDMEIEREIAEKRTVTNPVAAAAGIEIGREIALTCTVDTTTFSAAGARNPVRKIEIVMMATDLVPAVVRRPDTILRVASRDMAREIEEPTSMVTF